MTEETARMLNGKLMTDAVTSVEEPTELSHLTKSIISSVLEKNTIVVEYGGVTKTNILTAPKQEGKKLFQFLATLVAGLTVSQSGMALAWSSPTIGYLNSTDSFLVNMTDSECSWVSSLMPLGAMIGSIPAGTLANLYGRRLAIGITTTPCLISWIILIFGRSLPWLYLGRLMGGIGSGAAGVLVPVYIGEIAEPSLRGAMGTFFPFFFSLGIVFSYTAGAYLDYQTFNIACCLSLVPFLACISLMPEAPMWLLGQGRKLEAIAVLKILRGKKYDVNQEVAQILEDIEEAKNRKGGIRDLIGTLAGRRALRSCLGLMWFQQMCGIDAVLFYTVSIFTDAGSTIDPYLATIIIGLIEVIMAIIVGITIDRFGRKPLLIVSGFAMTIWIGILSYYFKLKEDGVDLSSIGWLPLLCLGSFNFVFSVGYGSVPYAMVGELFPQKSRAIASSISFVTNWFLVFIVTKFFHALAQLIGQSNTFWFFCSQCFLATLFAIFFVPETKGKTLHEIQMKLAGKIAVTSASDCDDDDDGDSQKKQISSSSC